MHGGTAVVGSTGEPVLVGQIEVPQDAVKKFSAVVRVNEVVVACLDVNREIVFANGSAFASAMQAG